MGFALVLMLVGCAHGPLKAASVREPTRYLGTWYEIAAFPSLERDCTGTTATYLPRADQKVDVIDRCTQGSVRGPERVVISQLQDAFIDLGNHDEFAVIGRENRSRLRVLSRKPQLDSGVYQMLLSHARDQGFDVSKLLLTPQ